MRIGDRINKFARRLAGDPGRVDLAPYWARVETINSFAPQFQRYSDSQLQDQAQKLKAQVRGGIPLGELLDEAYALVREVSARTIGLRPFDVQIIGSIGLYEGKIVEMGTGEGKTLAAVGTVTLNALHGRGVHVLTFNDYLAHRDAGWMGPIYRFLGLTVGLIEQGMGTVERRRAYEADVTYVTVKEAGFDFLRDELAYDSEDLVHRPFYMAVVDEADSILIDEARIPLVIAGATERREGRQDLMRTVVEQLASGIHYAVDDGGRNVYLTEEGAILAEQILECEDLYSDVNLQLLTELNLALHARILMRRDVDYIVRRGRVEIVDDFTGRVMEDRHWPYGLQAAIEVNEGLQPSEDAHILGSITVQHFLHQYPNLCGMTATAESAGDELFNIYDLEVLVVPPNRPCIRVDHPDLVFSTRDAKHKALLAEIETAQHGGRPVLVGTITVEESESLASDLERRGIKCNILNATRDDQEARVVAEAGDLGAVTISTNMAGRGTDIRLGGRSGERYEQVKPLGGLYVLGTNLHESRRIDYQLRGRVGRQGDPGSSRFFISLEDDYMVRYRIGDMLPKKWRSGTQSESMNNGLLRRMTARVQRVIEGQNYDIRQNLWRYSRFVESQRRIISGRRHQVLLREEPVEVLQERCPQLWQNARLALDGPTLRDIERRVMLLAIDECWSEHIERITNLQDGIHLAQVGGLNPLFEFQKQATTSFEQALNGIEDRAVEKFRSLEISSDSIDLERMGLRGPSSTWTYLVDDHGYADRLASTLVSQHNIGFAAGAALMWPLLILWPLIRRLSDRDNR